MRSLALTRFRSRASTRSPTSEGRSARPAAPGQLAGQDALDGAAGENVDLDRVAGLELSQRRRAAVAQDRRAAGDLVGLRPGRRLDGQAGRRDGGDGAGDVLLTGRRAAISATGEPVA